MCVSFSGHFWVIGGISISFGGVGGGGGQVLGKAWGPGLCRVLSQTYCLAYQLLLNFS